MKKPPEGAFLVGEMALGAPRPLTLESFFDGRDRARTCDLCYVKAVL